MRSSVLNDTAIIFPKKAPKCRQKIAFHIHIQYAIRRSLCIHIFGSNSNNIGWMLINKNSSNYQTYTTRYSFEMQINCMYSVTLCSTSIFYSSWFFHEIIFGTGFLWKWDAIDVYRTVTQNHDYLRISSFVHTVVKHHVYVCLLIPCGYRHRFDAFNTFPISTKLNLMVSEICRYCFRSLNFHSVPNKFPMRYSNADAHTRIDYGSTSISICHCTCVRITRFLHSMGSNLSINLHESPDV